MFPQLQSRPAIKSSLALRTANTRCLLLYLIAVSCIASASEETPPLSGKWSVAGTHYPKLDSPCAAAFPAANGMPDVYVFGGVSQARGYTNDLTRLTATGVKFTDTWLNSPVRTVAANVSVGLPPPRYECGAAVLGNLFIIAGGYIPSSTTSSRSTGTSWALDLSSSPPSWSLLAWDFSSGMTASAVSSAQNFALFANRRGIVAVHHDSLHSPTTWTDPPGRGGAGLVHMGSVAGAERFLLIGGYNFIPPNKSVAFRELLELLIKRSSDSVDAPFTMTWKALEVTTEATDDASQEFFASVKSSFVLGHNPNSQALLVYSAANDQWALDVSGSPIRAFELRTDQGDKVPETKSGSSYATVALGDASYALVTLGADSSFTSYEVGAQIWVADLDRLIEASDLVLELLLGGIALAMVIILLVVLYFNYARIKNVRIGSQSDVEHSSLGDDCSDDVVSSSSPSSSFRSRSSSAAFNTSTGGSSTGLSIEHYQYTDEESRFDAGSGKELLGDDLVHDGSFATVNIAEWTIADVGSWLDGMRERLAVDSGTLFRQERITGAQLMELDSDDLQALGISTFGDRRRILKSRDSLLKQQ